MLLGLVLGFEVAGLVGSIAGQFLVSFLVYPVAVWLARKQGVWDPLHDGVFMAVSAVIITIGISVNLDAILALI